jgi:SAM-dependent methyltransferase
MTVPLFGAFMALQRIRNLLDDRPRMLGIYFAAEGRAGREARPPATEVLVEPADGGRFSWTQLRRRGELCVPGESRRLLDIEDVIQRFDEALAAPAGAGVRLVLASRTGGELLEVRAGSTRRRALAPGEGASILSSAGLGRADSPGPAALLEAIGITSPQGVVRRDQRRKLNQVHHFVGLLQGLLERLPADRELLIVDCGCGKSQLLLVLNHVLTDRLGRRAHLVGLDSDPAAVRAAQRLQQRLGYRNMEYVNTTIRGWARPGHIDLVLSLHACDTATDEALALGVGAGAQGIVAVPCCQHELADQVGHPQLQLALNHAVLRHRFADWLTDALRVLALESCGYAVDVVEYVSPLDTPKNILLRAERRSISDRERKLRQQQAARLSDAFGVRSSLPGLIDAMSAPQV